MSTKPPNCCPVFRVRSVHSGRGICIGFTKVTSVSIETHLPEGVPKYDVIRICFQTKEQVKETSEREKRGDQCSKGSQLFCTPDEATNLGLALIKASALYSHEMKKP